MLILALKSTRTSRDVSAYAMKAHGKCRYSSDHS